MFRGGRSHLKDSRLDSGILLEAGSRGKERTKDFTLEKAMIETKRGGEKRSLSLRFDERWLDGII